MANDAFISYSAKDRLVADAVCDALEAEGIKCWIAPRDILPSEKYSQSIIKAIGESRLMILVFSPAANESDHVVSEVDRAYSKHKPIILFRIRDVPLSPSLEYYLSTAQWQDALAPSIEKHLPKLVRAVKSVLKGSSESVPAASQAQPEAPHPIEPQTPDPKARLSPTPKFKYLILACSILAVSALSYVIWTKSYSRSASSTEASPDQTSQTPPTADDARRGLSPESSPNQAAKPETSRTPSAVATGNGNANGEPVTEAKGVIYAVMNNDELRWYRHEGRNDGTYKWAPESGTMVGEGWDVKQVFSGGGGVIYAIRPNGDLIWNRHNGRDDGSPRWAADNGITVGTGWDFEQAFSGGGGVIYAIRGNGDLMWYRHEGHDDGSPRWALGGEVRKVGDGWDVKTAFSDVH